MSSVQRPCKRYSSLGGVVCYSLKGTLIYIKCYYVASVELNNARTNNVRTDKQCRDDKTIKEVPIPHIPHTLLLIIQKF